ncbi:MAG TPA: type II toxin-antitoxin system RelE/ParE family toxin [Chitinophagales bacterium]|jgi:plasmid stabilization system protein ParE|nr:type II toxin-antitoxin system RelE/ParE family toxin [Chitinophagales bacterium]
MLKILVTERAEISLNEIIDFYLMEHSIERTNKVLNSIDDALTKIAKSPLLNPICFDIRIPQENIRQLILHNTFKIIYRIQSETIEIIEIFHGNRNPELLSEIE